jgi:D-alanine-D-alanine ligase
MRIGIAFDLKSTSPPEGAPDDLYEEFDSPVTIRALSEVFRRRGHEVIELGNGRPLIERLLSDPPDLVFNMAEGTGTSRSREARVPAICETLGIPYTGSDPLTLAVGLDKDCSRRLVESIDVAIPNGLLMTFPTPQYDGDYAEFPPILVESEMNLPVIAKPLWEGSSKGIRSKCLVENPNDFGPAVVSLWHDYQQPVLVEEFINGDEITVGVIGNGEPRVIGMLRVLPKQATDRFIYSLEVKRDYSNRVEYEAPPKVPYPILQAIELAAISSYDALGCRDYARIDFRVRDGIPYFLEANPLPGLNPESSDLVIMTKLLGHSYDDLIGMILDEALIRLNLKRDK